MKQITNKELKEILEKHKKWLNEEDGGERAYLYEADLRGADLRGADLTGAYLTGANLTRADLRGANLTRANLTGADLREADFADDILIAYTNVCPQEGSFIAFKKASGNIVKLLIPEDAKRSNATSNKCRCDKAKVLGIYDKEHNLLDIQEVKSDYDNNFIYKVGEIVQADSFDDNRWNECSNGIHFFLTFEMAARY